MIDPSMTNMLLESPDAISLPMALDKIRARDEKIADLENKLSLKTQSWEFTSSQLQRRVAQIESFEGALKHNEWDFDSDTLQSLADFFDITLEREFDVTITVTFSGTVSAPMDYDMDNLENDLQATIDTHHYGNSDVVVDLSEDSMEIDYREY